MKNFSLQTFFRRVSILGLLVLAPVIAAQDSQCQNSADGLPALDPESGKLVCEIQSVSHDMTSQTFGLIKTVKVKSKLELPGQLEELLSLFLADVIRIPSQTLFLEVLTPAERTYSMKAVLAPEFTKTGQFCQDLMVVDFKLGIQELTSSDLPPFLKQAIRGLLNNSPELKVRGLEAAKGLVEEAQIQLCPR